MATELENIRVLTTRLHSHVFDWSDRDLQEDLLYLLDQLQTLHDLLDGHNAPGKDGHTTLMFRVREMHLNSRNEIQRQAELIESLTTDTPEGNSP
jgi:hypothetical protein